MEDGGTGVLVFEGIGYFVGFPTGWGDECCFLREDFGAFADEGAVQSGDELNAEGAGHESGRQPLR